MDAISIPIRQTRDPNYPHRPARNARRRHGRRPAHSRRCAGNPQRHHPGADCACAKSKGTSLGWIASLSGGKCNNSQVQGVDAILRMRRFFRDTRQVSVRPFALGSRNALRPIPSPTAPVHPNLKR